MYNAREMDPDEGIRTLVESETFVQAFSPGSTLEPGLKAFRQRGPKCPLETPTLLRTGNKEGVPTAFSRNDWRGLLAQGGITNPFSLSW
jgi:hypothetical protein